MQDAPRYANVVSEIKTFFAAKMDELLAGGFPEENIILDPGIGFGKNLAHNLAILSNLEEFYRNNRTEGFGIEVKRRIMLGTFVLSTGYYDAYYSKAQKIRTMLVNKMETIFANYDAILLPNSPETAFEFGKSVKDPIAVYLADIYTVLANLTGVPGISLPLFSHSNNMPFGLQVLTKRGNELTLLGISKHLLENYSKENPN